MQSPLRKFDEVARLVSDERHRGVVKRSDDHTPDAAGSDRAPHLVQHFEDEMAVRGVVPAACRAQACDDAGFDGSVGVEDPAVLPSSDVLELFAQNLSDSDDEGERKRLVAFGGKLQHLFGNRGI